MTRYFVGGLSIEGFRGINNDGDPLVLKFKTDAVNSPHAPNGVGKSSIFEAIHFAIFGTVPRLKALQDGEQGDSYVVNRFHPGQKATVDLVFRSDDGTPDVTVKVTRAANGARVVTSPSGHPQPEQFLQSLQEDFVLVDYGRFAKLIDISALERESNCGPQELLNSSARRRGNYARSGALMRYRSPSTSSMPLRVGGGWLE